MSFALLLLMVVTLGRGLFVFWPVFLIAPLTVLVPMAAFARARHRRSKGWSIAGVVVALCLLLASLRIAHQSRIYAISAITHANLHGIGQSLHIYCDDKREFPPDLQTLTNFGTSPKQFESMGDPCVIDGPTPAGFYSSFEYVRPSAATIDDSESVMAYEREAWSPMDLRFLWTPRGRYVLFVSSEVRLMNEEEFQRALRNSRAAERRP